MIIIIIMIMVTVMVIVIVMVIAKGGLVKGGFAMYVLLLYYYR